jgi:hypothetical protein
MFLRMTGLFVLLVAFFYTGLTHISAHAESKSATPAFLPCPSDPARLKARSDELQAIVKQDQQDRTEPINWEKVSPRDEARRKRIGEIFGEGCFKEAQDYAAAALVFQHGVLPDHFLQTFFWARKAVELGDPSQTRLMVMGLDRYLVNSGHMQLFATQASKQDTDDCWCMEEIEKSYSEKDRQQYAGKSLAEAMAWVDSLNKNSPKCKPTKICAKNLKASPRGTIPGFW